MYVQCPECEAVFRINTPQLTKADGLVRCGECGAVFDGMSRLRALAPDTVIEEEDLEEVIVLEEPARGPGARRASPQLDLPVEDRTPTLVEPPARSRPRAGGEAEIPRALRDDLAPKARARPASALGWVAVNLALVLVLLGQYAYFERRELYRYTELQPWLAGFCRVLGCNLPPRRDLSRIELLSRNVYSHPNVPDALMISATLVNNAPFPQPYPMLGLSMSDLQGRTVALRRFTPAEYLPAGLNPAQLMDNGVPVNVTLAIVDPGVQALAFEFDFF